MQISLETFLKGGFLFVMMDSLLTYQLGSFPVNSVLPVILLIAVLLWGPKVIWIPSNYRFLLILAFIGFSLGIATTDSNLSRFGKLVTAGAAFFIGFSFAYRIDNIKKFCDLLLIISLIYVSVCLLAVAQVAPSIFPVVTAMGMRDGVAFYRPEITTDQNFQIFYLFPGVVAMCLPFVWWRFSLAVAVVLGSIYILAVLQTRSGSLAIIGLTALSVLAPLLTRSLGWRKVALVFGGAMLLILFYIDSILEIGDLLIARFTSSQHSHTIYDRWQAFTFFYNHLFDPYWWLPRGNDEFLKLTGNLPHSTVTAFLFEAGILGVIAWTGLFFIPITRLGWDFFRCKLDDYGTVIFLLGLLSFIMQLSLNAPLYEHVWLWAGVVLAGLHRSTMRAGRVLERVLPITHPK